MLKKKPNYPIKTLDDSLSILETLLLATSAMSLDEISKKLRLYPSKVHRILDTLKYRGYVEQDRTTQKYQLGLKVVELGMAKLHKMNLLKESAPYLNELVHRCNETAYLGILNCGEVLSLIKEEPSHNIRMVSREGMRIPVHCTALGKILLAYLEPEEQEKILEEKGLPSFTKNTITNREKMRKELRKIKEQGFAEDIEEYEDGLSCLAAPIRNHQGKVIAALAIAGPTFRLANKNQKELKEVLIEITRRISRRLGYLSERYVSK